VTPAELIRGLAEEAPGVVRLAEEVSLAVQVDPALLRRARLDLGSRASAGTEAGLWFSPLVRSRSPAGFVLMPEFAAELRGRLARDPVRLATARARVERAHAGLPPALRLEEELLWLSVRPDRAAQGELEWSLRIAVASLVRDGRHGIAHWAARALPALPMKVRSLEPARILDAGARLRLAGDGGALAALAEDPGTRSSGWMVPRGFPTTDVHVRLLEDGIELAARAKALGHVIQVPSTDPLWVELHWRDAGDGGEGSGPLIPEDAGPGTTPVWVAIARGAVARIAGPVVGGVRLRTISGQTYEVRPVAVPWSSLRAGSSTLAPERSGPEALFLEHLGWIDRIAARVSRQGGLWDDEGQDFASSVRLSLMENDYAIMRKFRGEATLRTYLASVVTRLFHDYMRERRGRWRPSAAATRMGPVARDLEALVYRDGYRLVEAGERLRTEGRTALSDGQLGRLLGQIPPRATLRPRELPDDGLDASAGALRADDLLAASDAEALYTRVRRALARAMDRLEPEERTIAQMRFRDGRSVADVARELGVQQKPLFRQVERVRARLRGYLEAEGISASTVQGLLEEPADWDDGA